MRLQDIFEGISKIPQPRAIFHVSPTRNRASIRRKGLLIQNVEFPDVIREPGIHGMETPEQARDWAFFFMLDTGERIDIWRVILPPDAHIVPDPSREMTEKYDAWVLRQPVPPSALELIYTQPVRNSTRYAPPLASKITR